jgi:DNA (cytosine-5)-methyltransferase 1
MITVGSLFSGIGGIELGLERTCGFETIWFCENDRYASAVLKKNWKDVPNLGDITKVDWDAVEKPDMLTGGFPCQDISVAGKGKGIEGGHRSSLWFEYAKAIGILRPRIALVENVPALAYNGLDIVLADLAEMRYDAEWFSLSASDVGAWHRRERIFIVAYSQSRESREQEGRDRGKSVIGGSEEILSSNPTSDRCDCGECDRQGGYVLPIEKRKAEEDGKEWNRRELGAGEVCKVISNSDNSQTSRQRGDGREVLPISKPEGLDLCSSKEISHPKRIYESGFVHRSRERQSGRGGWWAAEPDVGRVADGVPFRVDRLRCLGNAVVPQVAQVIGEMILEVLA